MATLLRDTFTDANDTLLGSHLGETNAAWLSNTGFGSGTGTANEFVIKSNRLRRVDFLDPFGFDGGTALAYSSTSPNLDALPHFDVTFDLTFETGVTNSEIALYYDAQGGSATDIATISNSLISIAGGGSYAFSPVADQAYAIKLSRRGNNIILFVDDQMIEALPGVTMTGKFGFSMFDTGADTKHHIDNLLVESIDGAVYYDDFDGAGDLTAYSSDSGATYTPDSGFPSTILVRESGYLRCDIANQVRRTLVDFTLPAGVPTIEMIGEFVVPGGAGIRTLRLSLLHPDDPAQVGGTLFGAELRYLAGVTEIWAYNGDDTTTQDINELPGNPTAIGNVVSHLVATYDDATSEIVVRFNGAEVHRAVIPALDTEGWRPAIQISVSTPADTSVMYYTLVSVASPVETPAFWTNLIKTQEVI